MHDFDAFAMLPLNSAFKHGNYLEVNKPFWKRFLITIISMLAASFIAGVIWRSSFDMVMPGYLSGAVGGLITLPVWEFLKRIKPTNK